MTSNLKDTILDIIGELGLSVYSCTVNNIRDVIHHLTECRMVI